PGADASAQGKGLQGDGGGHLEDLAGDVGGVGGEQGGDQVGDLRGGTEPAQLDRFGQVGPGRLGHQGGYVAGSGTGPGGHGVDPDPEPAGLQGQRPGEPAH